MTRPDVEALAAALHEAHGDPSDFVWRPEAIIAALAASGWRITSAPEPSDAAGSRGRASDEVTADDPVSAQAAPDMPRTQAGRDLLRAINEYDDYFGIILDVESQAVRAALEGLRAEVDAFHGGSPDRNDAVDDALSCIDARLADLP